MTDHENSNLNPDLARAIGSIDYLENSVDAIWQDIRDLRDDDSQQSRLLSSNEATLAIFSSQLKQLTDRPSPLTAIITAVGVAVSIMALALTPVAWLSVQNSKRIDEDIQRTIERAYLDGAQDARIAGGEKRIEQLQGRFTNWIRNVEDRVRAHNEGSE